MKTQNKLLTPSEAMQILGISYSTLLRKVKSEKIVFIKIGKSLRFPSSYFEELEKKAFENYGGYDERS